MDRKTAISDPFAHIGSGTSLALAYPGLIAGFIPTLALTRVRPEAGCDRFSAGRASDSSTPSFPRHGRCHILELHAVMDIDASSMRTLRVRGL